MLKDMFDFDEQTNGFTRKINPIGKIDFRELKLLVKAHEKEIYDLSDDYIVARPHKDNHGNYPFSKLDFLSHKLLELVYPTRVPILYEAHFDDTVYFILEKVKLDPLHKAYNVWRQGVHKENGLKYDYDQTFLDVISNNESQCSLHGKKVDKLQVENKHNLDKYGITFDHSHVNISWRNSTFVALELHKIQRDYLFNFDKCYAYFNSLDGDKKEKGLALLERIKDLQVDTVKEIKEH